MTTTKIGDYDDGDDGDDDGDGDGDGDDGDDSDDDDGGDGDGGDGGDNDNEDDDVDNDRGSFFSARHPTQFTKTLPAGGGAPNKLYNKRYHAAVFPDSA